MSNTNLKESFSQENEDLFLAQKFPDKFCGFYVDIGAHHPSRFSNTALFYKKGWRGINVEANESIIPEFNKERLHDINLHFLVSDKCKKSTFYEFNDPALNTAKKNRVEFLEKNTNYLLLRENSMRCVSLNYILKRYLPKKQNIDFLNLDVEGNELEVLMGNNWSTFRPTYLLVEILEDHLKDVLNHKVTKFLKTKFYIPFSKVGRTVFFQDKKKTITFLQSSKALDQKKKIYILCPFFGRSKELIKLAKQLESQTYQNFFPIFINCNENKNIPFIISQMHSARVLYGKNYWWAQALDLGYEYLKKITLLPDSFVLILNQDVEIPKDFLESGLGEISDFGADLLGARSICMTTGKTKDSGVVWNWSDSNCRSATSPEEINCLSTRGLLIRSEVFLKLGSFRSWLLPHYLSDYAYTTRAYRAGYKLAVQKRFYLFHKTSSTFSKGILKLNFLSRVKFLFSNKCKVNPLHRLIFIWISYPNLKTKIRAMKQHLRSMRKMVMGDPEFLK